MYSVLMSIKPEFVQGILSGEKIYEFRKKACKRMVKHMYIYSTVPIQKVVGEAEIESILVESPEDLWEKTKAGAGVEKSFFDSYYKDKEKAVAYKLVNVTKYKTPKSLNELGIKAAPQSYQYVHI